METYTKEGGGVETKNTIGVRKTRRIMRKEITCLRYKHDTIREERG